MLLTLTHILDAFIIFLTWVASLAAVFAASLWHKGRY